MNGGSNSSEEPVLEQGGRRPRSLAWVSGVWRLQRNPDGETSCSYWAETEQAQGKRYTQERAQRKSAAQGTRLPRHFI